MVEERHLGRASQEERCFKAVSTVGSSVTPAGNPGNPHGATVSQNVPPVLVPRSMTTLWHLWTLHVVKGVEDDKQGPAGWMPGGQQAGILTALPGNSREVSVKLRPKVIADPEEHHDRDQGHAGSLCGSGRCPTPHL